VDVHRTKTLKSRSARSIASTVRNEISAGERRVGQAGPD
jgi:hypothetical protein